MIGTATPAQPTNIELQISGRVLSSRIFAICILKKKCKFNSWLNDFIQRMITMINDIYCKSQTVNGAKLKYELQTLNV